MKIRGVLLGFVLGFVLLAGSVFAGGYTSAIGTNVLQVLGMPSSTAAPAWVASTAVVVNQSVLSNGRVWLCVDAGTTGTVAPHGSVDFTDSGAIWRPVLRGVRQGLILANNSAAEITVAFFPDVTEGTNGVVLDVGAALVMTGYGTPQSGIFAVAGAAGKTLYACEW